MKAAIREHYGPPENIRIIDAQKPSAGAGQLLIRVHATTVNRTDCGYQRGAPFIIRFVSGLPGPRHVILGTEFAGTVEQIGAGVSSFAPGDKVFGYCEGTFGAHAEFMTMAASGPVATMPSTFSFIEAAAATEGAHYALSIIRRAAITSGQRVIVNGASGAIGSAAVQLLKAIDVYVTAVCSSRSIDLVSAFGVDQVIDYEREDFTKRAAKDPPYDCVVDAVGKSTFGRCRRLLKPDGRYVSTELGPGWQNPLLAIWTSLVGRQRVVFPFPSQSQEDVRYLRDLAEQGHYRPIVDRTWPLDQIVEAYRYVETGQKMGNVVLTVMSGPESAGGSR